MKKKLAKLALLAAATAFLLVAFPACSNDDDDDGIVSVTGVSLNKTAESVEIGKTVTLTAEVAPTNATNKAVTWKSSDDTIATVANGVVTGVKAGEATITVTTVDGEKTATCNVTVTSASSGTTEDYVLDLESIDATETTQKIDDIVTAIATASGKKVKYNSNGYLEMGGGKAADNYGLILTLPQAATITVRATKKAGGSANKLVLLSEDGKTVVAESSGIDENAVPQTDYTLEVEKAGTYIFGADSNGCWVYKFEISWK